MASIFDYSRVLVFTSTSDGFEKALKKQTLNDSRFDELWSIQSVTATQVMHSEPKKVPEFLFVVLLIKP